MKPKHVVWACVPVLGFFAAPFLPFVNGPHLWFGLPSVLVWAVLWTVGTTVALYAVERSADHADDAEHADDADPKTATRAEEAAR
ncbi:hypothetical protein [Streptacidiphilus sp. MAP5-3]|uniref:hypothetical protein n=1 Tax=unclassified Streptacidiphilus TaxID=2643834 RepID=UPI0035150BE7